MHNLDDFNSTSFIPSVVDCNYKRNKNIWNG